MADDNETVQLEQRFRENLSEYRRAVDNLEGFEDGTPEAAAAWDEFQKVRHQIFTDWPELKRSEGQWGVDRMIDEHCQGWYYGDTETADQLKGQMREINLTAEFKTLDTDTLVQRLRQLHQKHEEASRTDLERPFLQLGQEVRVAEKELRTRGFDEDMLAATRDTPGRPGGRRF